MSHPHAPDDRRGGPAGRATARRMRAGRSAAVVALVLGLGAAAPGCATGGAAAGPTPSTGHSAIAAASPGVPSPGVASPGVASPGVPSAGSPFPGAPGTRSASAPASAPAPATATGTSAASVTPTGEPSSKLPADGVGGVLVATYGTGGTSSLGILGRGTPQQAWDAVAARSRAFSAQGTAAAPAFELIVTVASSTAGRGGLYRTRIDSDVIDSYVRTAQANGGSVILDVQPGRSDFLTEAKALAPWLDQPGVGLALDPEWRMAAGQVPGRSIGSVDASEINDVSEWLEDLVDSRHLPDKVFLVHRFTTSMIRGDSRLADRPHLREIMNVDGFGTRAEKLAKYRAFAARSPWPMGLKLFTKARNDPDLLQPADVLALDPRPVIVNYQ